jgi:hypothetical protein
VITRSNLFNAAETLDLSEKMRGATAGRAVWNAYFKLWQGVPTDEHAHVLAEQIRKRKGLPIEPPKASEFIDNEWGWFDSFVGMTRRKNRPLVASLLTGQREER